MGFSFHLSLGIMGGGHPSYWLTFKGDIEPEW